MSQPNFSKAFEDGVVVEFNDTGEEDEESEPFTLRVRTLGELVVTSGLIVACDPLVMPEMSPFADAVPPGRYPVLVSVAEFANGDQRVAYALLRLSERPAVRWETAVPQGKSLSALKPGNSFGYPVDAGTGCFMDADAARALQAQAAEAAARHEDDEALFDALMATYVPTWSWANLILDETTGVNVIAYSSGWGDGWYPCYWGYDAAGARVALVTDFGVVEPAWLAS